MLNFVVRKVEGKIIFKWKNKKNLNLNNVKRLIRHINFTKSFTHFFYIKFPEKYLNLKIRSYTSISKAELKF